SEALDVLGLERLDELERTALRRHYMRVLRDHPPERDPDGFKRLREAFELVRRFASDDTPAAPPTEASPPVVVDASARPAQIEVAASAPPAQLEVAAIAEPEPPAPAAEVPAAELPA